MPSIVSYLEMKSRQEFFPVDAPAGFEGRKVNAPDGLVNQRMYREVGGDWDWTDRLVWSEEQWRAFAVQEGLETWLAYWEGEVAGYFELEVQDGGHVEIALFGLLPQMFGKGLGSAMLSLAVAQAWSRTNTTRVWLHTCTEDHPHALANYQKRGFRLFKTVEE